MESLIVLTSDDCMMNCRNPSPPRRAQTSILPDPHFVFDISHECKKSHKQHQKPSTLTAISKQAWPTMGKWNGKQSPTTTNLDTYGQGEGNSFWRSTTKRVWLSTKPSDQESPSVEHKTFVGCPEYNPVRMTWVKTNFLWMMFRSGWASKPNQERVLAIFVRRERFDYYLTCARKNGSVRGEMGTVRL